MPASSHSSTFFIVQWGRVARSNQLQIWTPFIDLGDPEIPRIYVRPFQHAAQSLECIHRRDIQTLINRLKQQNCVLSKSTKSTLWYSCHKNVMKNKIHDYMLQSKAFIVIEKLNLINSQEKVRDLLDGMVDQIQSLLKTFLDHQLITVFQYEQMKVQRSSVRFDFMYFQPDTRQQNQIRFEPKTVSILSPLMPVCRYLYRLLAPIYYGEVAHAITIYKGADLIPHLERYQQETHLKSTTHFIRIEIRNPYATITHRQLLLHLKCFLDDFISVDEQEMIQGMNQMAILKLTEFILEHQYSIYQDCIYQQVLGGSNTINFITLLIDIYFYYYWKQSLIRAYQNDDELFLRCFNELFLTWNNSKETFHDLIQKMKSNDPSLQYEICIEQKKIYYLDLQIDFQLEENTFHTQVYHDWKYEPYIMPTIYDAVSFSKWNTVQMALLRAILCCSDLEDFQQERQYIEFSFLFNHFCYDYIRECFEKCFAYFHVSHFMLHQDQAIYQKLRRNVRQYNQEILDKKTRLLKEKQKQCILYIYSYLKEHDLKYAQRNPKSILPWYRKDDPMYQGITIEVIGIPVYPRNTV